MYFDFDSLIKPVATCSNTSDRSSSKIKERHELCGPCLVVIEHNNPEPVVFRPERSYSYMQRFIENLQILAKHIYELKKIHRNYTISPQLPSDDCSVCEGDSIESERFLDQCLANRKFVGFAHSNATLNDAQ